MSSTQSSKKNDREILYSFWHDIPVIKKIPYDSFKFINEHPIRDAIVKNLRKGIEDDGRQRHALSLKELRPLVEEFINKHTESSKEIKLTSLYHHRDKMIEKGILQEVATFLEGKRHVTYYGRTARAFLGEFDAGKKVEKQKELLKNVIYAKNRGKDINKKKVNSTIEELIEEMIIARKELERWIEDNISMINQEGFDVIELFALLEDINKFNENILGLTEEIRQYLDL